jgi:hypothetical protein
MALQIQVTFPKYGFTASNAYLRVSNLRIDDSNAGWIVTFNLKCYFSANAKNNGKKPIEEEYHTFPYSVSSSNQDQYNTVKQAYQYLKTLSQYSSATDV